MNREEHKKALIADIISTTENYIRVNHKMPTTVRLQDEDFELVKEHLKQGNKIMVNCMGIPTNVPCKRFDS